MGLWYFGESNISIAEEKERFAVLESLPSLPVSGYRAKLNSRNYKEGSTILENLISIAETMGRFAVSEYLPVSGHRVKLNSRNYKEGSTILENLISIAEK